jgi:hypothetical protein
MQTEVVQPQSHSQVVLKQNKHKHNGKENANIRKQVLPKLKSNKEELKMILKKLEEVDPISKIDNLYKLQERALQQLPVFDNEGLGQIKTNRKDKSKEAGKNKSVKTVQKDFNLSEGSKVDDIRTIIRQNNYSANALNLKTLNILHELNTHNYRLYSLNRTTKVTESHAKSTKSKLISFLKKVA